MKILIQILIAIILFNTNLVCFAGEEKPNSSVLFILTEIYLTAALFSAGNYGEVIVVPILTLGGIIFILYIWNVIDAYNTSKSNTKPNIKEEDKLNHISDLEKLLNKIAIKNNSIVFEQKF